MSSQVKSSQADMPAVSQEGRQPQQKRARQTRQSILTAALELLEQSGIEKISTNLIARQAQITIEGSHCSAMSQYPRRGSHIICV